MKQKILIFILCYLFKVDSRSQANILSLGGDIVGISGSISYSIGQIDYVSIGTSALSMNQGVQQPYEFFIITGINQNEFQLQLSVYPNPTHSLLILDIGVQDFSGLFYQVYDARNILLWSKSIEVQRNSIDLAEYYPGTYFLLVGNKYKERKSFKIIKNQ